MVGTRAQHGGAHEKTRRLAQLHLKGFVLRQTLCRAATGKNQHFGTVIEEQAGLPQRQRIAARKRLEIQQAGAQRSPLGSRRAGLDRRAHRGTPASLSARLSVQPPGGALCRRTGLARRASGLRIAIAVIAFIAVV